MLMKKLLISSTIALVAVFAFTSGFATAPTTHAKPSLQKKLHACKILYPTQPGLFKCQKMVRTLGKMK